MTSVRLGPELDLPAEHAAQGHVPSTNAYQCPRCNGIAYNPVCPYCADEEGDEPT